ncbi:MAG: flagellar hook-basal body protein [Eubacteriales bacterium]
MNMAFYSASVGAQQQMLRMGVQANNVANVNHYGYKNSVAGFTNLMYGSFVGAEEEILERGAGAVMVQTSTDWSQSSMVETGYTFDFAVEGDGFFALYDPATTDITYTRNGSFSMAHVTLNSTDEAGVPETGWYLCDGNGLYVADMRGNFIPIDPDADPMSITPDSLNIGLFDFNIKDGMVRTGPDGFAEVEKNGNLQLATGKIHQGYLETSNVDLAVEMTKVIESQRLYTYALKMVQTSDEVETTINGLSS